MLPGRRHEKETARRKLLLASVVGVFAASATGLASLTAVLAGSDQVVEQDDSKKKKKEQPKPKGSGSG